jgi:hypothetical protein
MKEIIMNVLDIKPGNDVMMDSEQIFGRIYFFDLSIISQDESAKITSGIFGFLVSSLQYVW